MGQIWTLRLDQDMMASDSRITSLVAEHPTSLLISSSRVKSKHVFHGGLHYFRGAYFHFFSQKYKTVTRC